MVVGDKVGLLEVGDKLGRNVVGKRVGDREINFDRGVGGRVGELFGCVEGCDVGFANGCLLG
jgi:hypothetical protein